MLVDVCPTMVEASLEMSSANLSDGPATEVMPPSCVKENASAVEPLILVLPFPTMVAPLEDAPRALEPLGAPRRSPMAFMPEEEFQ